MYIHKIARVDTPFNKNPTPQAHLWEHFTLGGMKAEYHGDIAFFALLLAQSLFVCKLSGNIDYP